MKNINKKKKKEEWGRKDAEWWLTMSEPKAVIRVLWCRGLTRTSDSVWRMQVHYSSWVEPEHLVRWGWNRSHAISMHGSILHRSFLIDETLTILQIAKNPHLAQTEGKLSNVWAFVHDPQIICPRYSQIINGGDANQAWKFIVKKADASFDQWIWHRFHLCNNWFNWRQSFVWQSYVTLIVWKSEYMVD